MFGTFKYSVRSEVPLLNTLVNRIIYNIKFKMVENKFFKWDTLFEVSIQV